MNNFLSSVYQSKFWRDFDKESFQMAQERQKPLLLVLSKPLQPLFKSLEQQLLNQASTLSWIEKHFIAIQVDIDLRPDVYDLYSYLCLSLNNGELLWPLFLFLDPQGRAYSVGTWDVYKEKDRPGGFLKQLVDNYQLWAKENSRCLWLCEQSEKSLEQLKRSTAPKNAEEQDLKNLKNLLLKSADPLDGGWDNGRGKFLPWNQLNYLLAFHSYSPEKKIEQQLKHTLLSMLQGGIYDLVEGNFFHRSQQLSWDEPVFEKHCLDNALALMTWTRAAHLFKKPFFKLVSQRLGESLFTNFLHSPQGGFFKQLETLDPLNSSSYYSAEEEISPLNTWYLKGGMPRLKLNEDSLLDEKNWETLEKSLHPLKEQRKVKKGLFKDESLFLKDNAAIITALLALYQLLKEEKYLALAKQQEKWVNKHFLYKQPYPRLIRHKQAKATASLEDLSYLLEAYIALYSSTQNPEYRKQAEDLQQHIWEDYFFNGDFHTLPSSHYLPLSFQKGADPLYPSAVIKTLEGFYQLYKWKQKPFPAFLMQYLSEIGQRACFQPLVYPGYFQLMLKLCSFPQSFSHLLEKPPQARKDSPLPFLLPCVGRQDKFPSKGPLVIASDSHSRVNEWRLLQHSKQLPITRVWSSYVPGLNACPLSSADWVKEVERSLWSLGLPNLEGYFLPSKEVLATKRALNAFEGMEELVQQRRLQSYGLILDSLSSSEAKSLYELSLQAGKGKSHLKVLKVPFKPLEKERHYLLSKGFLEFCKSHRWQLFITGSFEGLGYSFLPSPPLAVKHNRQELRKQLEKLEHFWEKYSKRKLIATKHPALKEWLCKLFQVQQTLEKEREKPRNEKDWQHFESLFTHQFLDHFAFLEKHLKVADGQFLLDFKADFFRLIQEICYEERRLIRVKNTEIQKELESLINPHLQAEEKKAPLIAKWLTLCKQRFPQSCLCLSSSTYEKVKGSKVLHTSLPVEDILNKLSAC